MTSIHDPEQADGNPAADFARSHHPARILRAMSRDPFTSMPSREVAAKHPQLKILDGGRREVGRSVPPGLLVLCGLVAVIVALPFIATVIEAVSGDWRQTLSALSGSDIPTLALNTLVISAAVVPLCGVLGVTAAWFVERTGIRARRIWTLLLVAPITIPLFVTSYAWAGFGPAWQGLVGGICIASFSYYPIVFLLAAASLRGMDPALEESARALGCPPRAIFRRVVLPQLRPSILGGMLIVTLAMFVQDDAFVGLHYPVFVNTATALYRVSLSAAGAALLSAGTAIPCVLLLSAEFDLRGKARFTRVGSGSGRRATRYDLGKWQFLVIGGLAMLAAAGVGIPVGTLIVWFAQRSPQALSGAPAGISDLLPASLTSILVCAASAVVGIALALPTATLVTRFRGRLPTLLERVAYLPFALPDFMGAVAIGSTALFLAPFLYGNVVLLVLNSAILFVPLALVGLRVSLEQVDPRLGDAARSLGLGGWRSFVRVDMHLARPGIAASAVLVFVFTLGALSSTQLLLPAGMTSLTTLFEQDAYAESFAAAAPYAAAMLILSALATYVLMSRFGKVRGLGDQ